MSIIQVNFKVVITDLPIAVTNKLDHNLIKTLKILAIKQYQKPLSHFLKVSLT